MKYGRKIISNIFKKRPERTSICAELESRSQADSDRSDIRVFEVGLSDERLGDNEYGSTYAAQEAESNRLIAVAKANELYIPRGEWEKFGDRKRLPSGESIVYLDKDGKKVIKVRNPFAKSTIKQMRVQDAIYEHLIHNMLFPSTRYNFEGISEDAVGVRIILSQPYISKKYILPTQELIDAYLIEGLKLIPENKYFYGNEYLAITDVSADSDNVLADDEKLYFIDPIIKLKKPAVDVLEYYYKQLK